MTLVGAKDEFIKTKRWNDPAEPSDGHRILVCRYRPRGVRKADETWDVWAPELGPSRDLHADFYGKHGPPIGWTEYRRRYLAEMKEKDLAISALAARLARLACLAPLGREARLTDMARVRAGERITLLCSSACTDPERCHRTLLAELIEQRVARRRSR